MSVPTAILSPIKLPDGKLRCPYCPKVFAKRRRGNLTVHMRLHTGERRFICSLCDRRFQRKATLDSHLLAHARIRPFACTHCPKRFTQSAQLTRHMQIHTGEKPWQCVSCSRKFSDKRNLRRHIVTRHDGNTDSMLEVLDRRVFEGKQEAAPHRVKPVKPVGVKPIKTGRGKGSPLSIRPGRARFERVKYGVRDSNIHGGHAESNQVVANPVNVSVDVNPISMSVSSGHLDVAPVKPVAVRPIVVNGPPGRIQPSRSPLSNPRFHAKARVYRGTVVPSCEPSSVKLENPIPFGTSEQTFELAIGPVPSLTVSPEMSDAKNAKAGAISSEDESHSVTESDDAGSSQGCPMSLDTDKSLTLNYDTRTDTAAHTNIGGMSPLEDGYVDQLFSRLPQAFRPLLPPIGLPMQVVNHAPSPTVDGLTHTHVMLQVPTGTFIQAPSISGPLSNLYLPVTPPNLTGRRISPVLRLDCFGDVEAGRSGTQQADRDRFGFLQDDTPMLPGLQ